MRCNAMATQSIFFCSFKVKQNWNTEAIVERIFKDDYNENEDRFVLQNYDDEIIEGIYVIQFLSKEWVFNPQSKSVESVDFRKTTIIPFSINLSKKSIDIWGNKTNTQKLMVKIGILLDNQVEIDTICITLPDVIQKLKSQNIIYGKVKIENFLLQSNLVASCLIDLTNYERPIEILEKYKKDIVQLSVCFRNYEDLVTVTFYSSGSIVLYKSKDDISQELFDRIKMICTG